MARFRHRIRRFWVPLLTTVLGGTVVFTLQHTIFKPHPIPVVISSFSHTPLLPLSPHEFERSIRINPCVDLHSYVCSLARTEDPTGEVKRDSEGEVEVLRIYEDIIRTHRHITPEKADEILVRKIYTKDRVARLQDLFGKAKKNLIKFIQLQFRNSKPYERDLLQSKIEKVRLELPPPASVYKDEPDLFTRNDVYFEKTSDGSVRIRMGGALLFTVHSQFNLAFTLAHELAHAIDPCELYSDHIDISAYHSLMRCLGSSLSNMTRECSSKGKLAEMFSDWIATHIVAEILTEAAPHFSQTQIRSSIFSTVRDLCSDEEEVKDVDRGLSASHPNVAFRVNRIFAQHPKIKKLLGCQEMTGPPLPASPFYCAWPATEQIY